MSNITAIKTPVTMQDAAIAKFRQQYKPNAAELLAFIEGYRAAIQDQLEPDPSIAEISKRMLEL